MRVVVDSRVEGICAVVLARSHHCVLSATHMGAWSQQQKYLPDRPELRVARLLRAKSGNLTPRRLAQSGWLVQALPERRYGAKPALGCTRFVLVNRFEQGSASRNALLSFRQKVESPGLSKRRFCAFDWPKRRSACLGLSSFWRNDHTRNNDLSEGARADDMWLGPAPRWRRLGSTCWVAISGHRQSFPVHGVCTTLVCCMHMD